MSASAYVLALWLVVLVRQVSHAARGAVSVEHDAGVLCRSAGDVRDALSAAAEHTVRVDGASAQSHQRRRALQRPGQRPHQRSVARDNLT